MKNGLYRCTRGARVQIVLHLDLEHPSTRDFLFAALPDKVSCIYSDPPWNPGNATYWRTMAGLDPCASYHSFQDRWCDVVSQCISRGASDVFCEQSANTEHQQMFMNAVARQSSWTLPLVEQWIVFYGSWGIKPRRPNVLLHFGSQPIATDPSGLSGEPMTLRVCAGVHLKPGSWMVDPCMGKGMTSRMAHYFDLNCLGVEMNFKRLDVTLRWLKRQGYAVIEEASC